MKLRGRRRSLPCTQRLLLPLGLLAASAAACGSTPRQGGPAPPPQAAPRSSEAQLADRDWRVLWSRQLRLKLALPEGAAWVERKGAPEGAAWELRHEPTGSTVTVKRWRASRLPRVDACEADLRTTIRQFGDETETELVDTRLSRAPDGFTTKISLFAMPGRSGRLRGVVVAVSAGVGECLAAVARTECATEIELAERLRLLEASTLRLRVGTVEDRAPRRVPLED